NPGVAAELDALLAQLFHPPADEALVQLEVGDAVKQQTAGFIRPLEDGDRVAGAAELLRSGEAGRARADDGDGLPGAEGRRLGLQPALFPRAVADLALDELDR